MVTGVICGGGWSFVAKLKGARKYKWGLVHQPNSLWYEPTLLSTFPTLAAATAAWRREPRRMTKAERWRWINAELENEKMPPAQNRGVLAEGD